MFFVFRDSYVLCIYIYIYIYEQSMYISHSHIITMLYMYGIKQYPGHSLVEVLSCCRSAVGVFYRPSRMSKILVKIIVWNILCTNYLQRNGVNNITVQIIRLEFLKPHNCELFVLRIITWNSRNTTSGVVADVLDCDTVVREFELQLRYCIHFMTNTLRKGMNPTVPIPDNYLKRTIIVLLRWWLWH